MNNRGLISIDKEIRFGRPCIAGTRIAVSDVLSWLASGMTIEEIINDFPLLTKAHILAALEFSSHRESITNYLVSSL